MVSERESLSGVGISSTSGPPARLYFIKLYIQPVTVRLFHIFYTGKRHKASCRDHAPVCLKRRSSGSPKVSYRISQEAVPKPYICKSVPGVFAVPQPHDGVRHIRRFFRKQNFLRSLSGNLHLQICLWRIRLESCEMERETGAEICPNMIPFHGRSE